MEKIDEKGLKAFDNDEEAEDYEEFEINQDEDN